LRSHLFFRLQFGDIDLDIGHLALEAFERPASARGWRGPNINTIPRTEEGLTAAAGTADDWLGCD